MVCKTIISKVRKDLIPIEAKKIYRKLKTLVSDELIDSSDEKINEELPYEEAGDIIFSAGAAVVKQKALDGTWVRIDTPLLNLRSL